jgi:hypothetical protein
MHASTDRRRGPAKPVGGSTVAIPLAPLRKEDAPNKELEEAWEYYHTPPCEYPPAPGFATARSLNQIITYASSRWLNHS